MKREFRLFLSLAFLLPTLFCKGQVYPVPTFQNPFPPNYAFNQYYWLREDEATKMSRFAKKEALDSAKANIKLLKQNTLVVRLRTGSSKIKALNRLMNSPNVDEKHRLRYQSMIEKTTAEVREENLSLMDAFTEKYTFSKMLFMPDTLGPQLKNGVKQGIFLNNKLEIDPSLGFQGYFFLAYYGESDSKDKTHIEGINVVDQEFEPLRYPFPSFVGRAGIWRGLREFLFVAPSSEHYVKLVEKLNKTMEIN